jgi:hypothetical protein
VGNYFFLPGGSVLGALLGHVVGRMKARSRANYYERLDATMSEAILDLQSTPESSPAIAEPAPSAP